MLKSEKLKGEMEILANNIMLYCIMEEIAGWLMAKGQFHIGWATFGRDNAFTVGDELGVIDGIPITYSPRGSEYNKEMIVKFLNDAKKLLIDNYDSWKDAVAPVDAAEEEIPDLYIKTVEYLCKKEKCRPEKEIACIIRQCVLHQFNNMLDLMYDDERSRYVEAVCDAQSYTRAVRNIIGCLAVSDKEFDWDGFKMCVQEVAEAISDKEGMETCYKDMLSWYMNVDTFLSLTI